MDELERRTIHFSDLDGGALDVDAADGDGEGDGDGDDDDDENDKAMLASASPSGLMGGGAVAGSASEPTVVLEPAAPAHRPARRLSLDPNRLLNPFDFVELKYMGS